MRQFLKHVYCSLFHKASTKMMDSGCCVTCEKCKYSEVVLFVIIAVPFLVAAASSWIRADEFIVPIMRMDMYLESADDASGPWTSRTNIYTLVAIDEPQQFYRVRLEATRFSR